MCHKHIKASPETKLLFIFFPESINETLAVPDKNLFAKNTYIHLYSASFLHIKMEQVVEILHEKQEQGHTWHRTMNTWLFDKIDELADWLTKFWGPPKAI